MGLLAEIFYGFIGKNKDSYFDSKVNFVFYKIVDYHSLTHKYGLQCINTKAVFYAKINEIVFDIDILHGLHPIQACYIGIEYAKYHKKNISSSSYLTIKQKTAKYPICRYGTYKICCQDREGNIEFHNEKTHKKYWMDPRDIALSEELIQEFDAQQAFHVGLFAGLKMTNSATQEIERQNPYKRPNLKLVK